MQAQVISPGITRLIRQVTMDSGWSSAMEKTPNITMESTPSCTVISVQDRLVLSNITDRMRRTVLQSLVALLIRSAVA